MLLHSALACQELRCPLSWQLCALTASHVSCTHAAALRSRLPGIALPFLLATLCIVSLACSCTHASALRSRLPGIALPFLLATLCIDSFTCFLHACCCTPLSPARNCVALCPGNFVHCQLDMFPARMLLHSALACQALRCPFSWQLCALTASHVSCMRASTLRSRLPGIALSFVLATSCIVSLTCFLHLCSRLPGTLVASLHLATLCAVRLTCFQHT